MSYWKLILFVCVGMIFSGCKSTLSRKPYTTLEKHWIQHLKGAYPNWNPPIKPPNYTLAGESQPVVEELMPVYEEIPAPAEIEAVPLMAPSNIVMEEEAPPLETHLAKTQEQIYTIQKGDTLSEISLSLYGTSKLWKRIVEANPEAITNPNKLKVGTKIVIPPK